VPDVRNDPVIFQEFRDALGARDPKTIATYLTTMRDFVNWLAELPGGTPFHLGLPKASQKAPSIYGGDEWLLLVWGVSRVGT
jgi:hypothetical protein